jgi:hypothetical protein
VVEATSGWIDADASADAGDEVATDEAALTDAPSLDESDTAGQPADGCGTVPTQPPHTYVLYNEVVPNLPAQYAAHFTNRIYYVWLPNGYDPTRRYPTAFLAPGCGQAGNAPIPLQVASQDNAIIVGLNAADTCFTKAADTPDIPYFDETLKEVTAAFCVDKSRIYVAGFSSGSWLTNALGCARAGIIRGQGNASGGLPPLPACTGPIAAMIAFDETDPQDPISGGMMARDRILAANSCGTQTVPYDIGFPSPCVEYQGCMPGYPVVWCATVGQGHSDQVATHISTFGFWQFWSSLP